MPGKPALPKSRNFDWFSNPFAAAPLPPPPMKSSQAAESIDNDTKAHRWGGFNRSWNFYDVYLFSSPAGRLKPVGSERTPCSGCRTLDRISATRILTERHTVWLSSLSGEYPKITVIFLGFGIQYICIVCVYKRESCAFLHSRLAYFILRNFRNFPKTFQNTSVYSFSEALIGTECFFFLNDSLIVVSWLVIIEVIPLIYSFPEALWAQNVFFS